MNCPTCGHKLVVKTERDELSNGTIVGSSYYWCENCSDWFLREDLEESN